MAYLAFYRMFRPDSLDKVVRQEHIVKILCNQIESGKIGHAYLFCGPRGTGKTSVAKIFARAINCEKPKKGSPCGKCPACSALASGGNLDISEIDAASNNGVDEMRDLREKVQYPPVAGKYKVYIIDEVHMLTTSAFNAVLKTLEEPPAHAVFILATTEPHKIPATILSRCMRFDFKLIPQKDLEVLLKDILSKVGKPYEEEAVAAIARAGAGSARDTLSIADMCVSYSEGKLTYGDINAVLGSADFYKVAKAADMLLSNDAGGALSCAEEVFSGGKSAGVFVKDILGFLNNCAVAKMCKNAKEILNLPEEMFAEIERIARADGHKILRATEIFVKAEGDMRYAADARVVLETAIMRCTMPQADYDIDALIARVAAIENKLKDAPVYRASVADTVEPQQNLQHSPHGQVGIFGARQDDLPSAPSISRRKATPSSYGSPPSQSSVSDDPFSDDASFAPSSPNTSTPTAPKGTPPAPTAPNAGAPTAGSSSQCGAVHAKLLRALRTTHRNAVLFTLCQDLICTQEGDKLIFSSDNDTVCRALNRADNAKLLADILAENGVLDFEVRVLKNQDGLKRALDVLKDNFGGTDIEIK